MELNSELDRLQKYAEIDSELNRAKKKWPDWPENIFEQLAVMQEEAGEVTMAVLHYVHEGGNIEDVKSELIQTAAMCMRMLENLPDSKIVSPKKDSIKCTPHKFKFKKGDKVKIKEGISNHTHYWEFPGFTKKKDAYIGKVLTVYGYDRFWQVEVEECEYTFSENWLEPADELKVGDLVIAWNSRGNEIISTLDVIDKGTYKYLVANQWHKNALKWDGTIEQLEKVRRGDLGNMRSV